jgi:hypothetical protein
MTILCGMCNELSCVLFVCRLKWRRLKVENSTASWNIVCSMNPNSNGTWHFININMSRIESNSQTRIHSFHDFCFLFTQLNDSCNFQFEIYFFFCCLDAAAVTLIFDEILLLLRLESQPALCMPNDLLTNVTFISFITAFRMLIRRQWRTTFFYFQFYSSIARHLKKSKRNWKRGMERNNLMTWSLLLCLSCLSIFCKTICYAISISLTLTTSQHTNQNPTNFIVGNLKVR